MKSLGSFAGVLVLLVAALAAPAALAATVSLPVVSGCPGGDLVVPIAVEPADGVIGMDLVLAYDPSVVTPVAVHQTAFGGSLSVFSNVPAPGRLELALFGVTPLTGPGEVVCVVFHAAGPVGSGSPLVWLRHDLNEGDVPSTAVDGHLAVAASATSLSLPDDATGTPGSLVELPITADPADGYVGVDLIVRWNPMVLQAVDLTLPPGMPPDWTAIFNLIAPGEALVALFGTTPLSGPQPVATLRAIVVGDPGDATPLDILRGDVNEGTIPSCLDDGLFFVCPDCNDNNPCTVDTCDAGVCLHDPVAPGTDCTDGNPCTANDACAGTVCVGGAPTNCDDVNPCTDDACDPQSGCTHTPDDAGQCSDGSACTRDLCQGGQCVTTPVDCDDANPCTDDACDPASGCYHTPNDANPCSDGSACTADRCLDGACVGSPIVCDDANPCTSDSCNPATGCVFVPNDANPCTDGNACTRDACQGGACVSTPVSCDDGNVCTTDACHPATGCIHAPTSGGACSDGNACTTADTCQNGACVGGAPPNCNDGNACTDDTCDPAAGCVNACNDTCSGNPRSYGFYKRLCRGPHPSGEFLTANDAACVHDTCTFASVATVADICDRLDPNPPSDKCEHAEAQFMTLMLNVCRCRVNRYQPIDASCGPGGSVARAIADADAKLCNPARTRDECILAHCGAEDVNSGAALWANSVRVTKVAVAGAQSAGPDAAGPAGSGVAARLTWAAPYAAPTGVSNQKVRSYRIWRRAGSDLPFVMIAEVSGATTAFTDVAPAGADQQYEVTAVW